MPLTQSALPDGALLPLSGVKFVVHTRTLEHFEPPRDTDLVILGHHVGSELSVWTTKVQRAGSRVIAVRGVRPSSDDVLEHFERMWGTDTFLMTARGVARSLTDIVDLRLLHTLQQSFGGKRPVMAVIPPTTDALFALLRGEGLVFPGMMDDAAIMHAFRQEWDSVSPLGEVIDYALRRYRADVKAYASVVAMVAGLREKMGERAFGLRVFEDWAEIWAVRLSGDAAKAATDVRDRFRKFRRVVLPACKAYVARAQQSDGLLLVDTIAGIDRQQHPFDVDEIARLALFDEEGPQAKRVAVRWAPKPRHSTDNPSNQITVISRPDLLDVRDRFGVQDATPEKFTFAESPGGSSLADLLKT